MYANKYWLGFAPVFNLCRAYKTKFNLIVRNISFAAKKKGTGISLIGFLAILKNHKQNYAL